MTALIFLGFCAFVVIVAWIILANSGDEFDTDRFCTDADDAPAECPVCHDQLVVYRIDGGTIPCGYCK